MKYLKIRCNQIYYESQWMQCSKYRTKIILGKILQSVLTLFPFFHCEFCHDRYAFKYLDETDSGDLVCENCLSELCYRCESVIGEYESPSDSPICLDCMTGEADALYDMMREDAIGL